MTPAFDGKVLEDQPMIVIQIGKTRHFLRPTKMQQTQIVVNPKNEPEAAHAAKRSHVSARFWQRPSADRRTNNRRAWVLTALGSRGFLTAPLLAEILLDEMEGRETAGLPTYDFASCVHPNRSRKKL